MAENDRRTESGRESRRNERDRREPRRDLGVWPYGGPSALGYRGPAYLGYPGYMSYPWSRCSHGMDPSYEDWQRPGFGTGNWEPPTHSYERDKFKNGILDIRVSLPERRTERRDARIET